MKTKKEVAKYLEEAIEKHAESVRKENKHADDLTNGTLIGKRWTVNMGANTKWQGYDVECVRRDTKVGAYEQILYDDGMHSTPHYPEGGDLQHEHWIIQCIDPRFWTGDILDENVRCYDNGNGCVNIVTGSDFVTIEYNSINILDKACLYFIKSKGIPIMPTEQSKCVYSEPAENDNVLHFIAWNY